MNCDELSKRPWRERPNPAPIQTKILIMRRPQAKRGSARLSDNVRMKREVPPPHVGNGKRQQNTHNARSECNEHITTKSSSNITPLSRASRCDGDRVCGGVQKWNDGIIDKLTVSGEMSLAFSWCL